MADNRDAARQIVELILQAPRVNDFLKSRFRELAEDGDVEGVVDLYRRCLRSQRGQALGKQINKDGGTSFESVHVDVEKRYREWQSTTERPVPVNQQPDAREQPPDIDQVRGDLRALQSRVARGEIGEHTYLELKQGLVGELSEEDIAGLGLIPTPTPRSISGVKVGPSGGRTRVPSLADLELTPGTVLLDQWKIVREIGRGGFGAVFEARDVRLNETYAIKVLDPAMVRNEELLSRFRREVSVMRRLNHRGIVRVYDYVEDIDHHLALISMEFINGCSAYDLLANGKGEQRELIPIQLALQIFEQTLVALAAVHAQGVIHRDVTPRNILLAGGTRSNLMGDQDCDPCVKLVDFGIAGLIDRTELSAKSRALGTAAYIAPEVLDPDATISESADVYSVGAVVYELLSRKTPFVSGRKPINELRDGIRPEVSDLLMTCVHADADDRPNASGALRSLRLAYLEKWHEAEQAKVPSLKENLGKALDCGDYGMVKKSVTELRIRLGAKAAHDKDILNAEAWLEGWRKKRKDAEARGEGLERSMEKREILRRLTNRVTPESPDQPNGTTRKAKYQKDADRALAGIGAREEERKRKETDVSRQNVRATQRRVSQGQSKRPLSIWHKPMPDAIGAISGCGIVLLMIFIYAFSMKANDRGWWFFPPSAPTARPVAVNFEETGTLWTDPEIGMRFRYIPAGSFQMGSPSSEAERGNDERQRQVTITRGFWIGETEVTQRQWKAVMGSNPSHFTGSDDLPVEMVSWNDAVRFANDLSQKAGLEQCYEMGDGSITSKGLGCEGYRLPTEAEWEYAARAGTTTPFWTGEALRRDQANFDRDLSYLNSEKADRSKGTMVVRSFSASPWGLYDVHGNVWEWCWDNKGGDRVWRGGGFENSAGACRSANRFSHDPRYTRNDLGFRLVRTANLSPMTANLTVSQKLIAENRWLAAYERVMSELKAHPKDPGLEEVRKQILEFEPLAADFYVAIQSSDYRAAVELSNTILIERPDDSEVGAVYERVLFNAALAELRAFNLSNAESYLTDLQQRQPEDSEIPRILEFIETYKTRPIDIQLENFIGSLSKR